MKTRVTFTYLILLVALLASLFVQPTNAQVTWTHLNAGGSVPSARQSSGAVYVKAPGDTYGAMYVFGGYGSGSRFNDMYKLTLRPGQEQWTRFTQQGLWPSPRTGFVMVYDSAGNRILGYGGDEGNNLRGDNWAFNLSTSRWWPIDTLLGYVAPPARVGGNTAYFSGTRKLYLFGGQGFRNPIGWYWHDTWQLDPSSGMWQQLTPNGNYIPRQGGVAAIDEANNRMIIFGGVLYQAGGLYYFNEAWKIGPLDQANMTIEQLFPSGSSPPAMRHSVAVYDSTGNRMIIFSGQDDGGSLHNEVWELQLAPGQERWNTLSPGGQIPPAMYLAAAVLDRPNRRMIVFGGNTGGGQINDVYSLGPLWTAVEEPAHTPATIETRFISAYPNPSQKTFVFEYQLARPTQIELRVYDITGRLVRTLTDRVNHAGTARVIWDGNSDNGRTCPSGVYFYELKADEKTFRGKIAITR